MSDDWIDAFLYWIASARKMVPPLNRFMLLYQIKRAIEAQYDGKKSEDLMVELNKWIPPEDMIKLRGAHGFDLWVPRPPLTLNGGNVPSLPEEHVFGPFLHISPNEGGVRVHAVKMYSLDGDPYYQEWW